MDINFDIISYINESYSCPETKELIFGNSKVASRHVRGPSPLFRIVLSGALLIYLKWRSLERKERIKYSSKHFSNVEELFLDLYKGTDFNTDSAIYILFEAQKDVEEQKEKSFFYDLLDVSEHCQFGKIYGVIDEWENNTDHVIKSYSEEYVSDLLVSAIKSVKILKDYKIDYQNGLSFLKEKDEIKDERAFIYKDYEFMILKKMESYTNMMNFVYICLSDFRIVLVEEKRQ